MLDVSAMMAAILDGYLEPARGDHGVVHWPRVLESGLQIVEVNGADREMVTLFALFAPYR